MKGKKIRVKLDQLKFTLLRQDAGTEEELKWLARSWLGTPIHDIIISQDWFYVDGNRRGMGLKLLGETEVEVFQLDEALDERARKRIGLISAVHRKDLGDYDRAEICHDLLDVPGKLAKDLVPEVQMSASTISKLLSLWKCIPVVIEAAKLGKITVGHWYRIAALQEGDQEGLLNMFLAGIPVAQAEAEHRKRRTPQETERVSRVNCPLPGGLSVTVAGKELDLDQTITALSDALKSAKKAREDGLTAKSWSVAQRDKAKGQENP